MPSASNATFRAAVPEFAETAWGAPTKAANSASKAGTSGPQSSRPLSSTRRIAASIAGLCLR